MSTLLSRISSSTHFPAYPTITFFSNSWIKIFIYTVYFFHSTYSFLVIMNGIAINMDLKQLSSAMQAFNPSTRKLDVGLFLWVQGQPGQHSEFQTPEIPDLQKTKQNKTGFLELVRRLCRWRYLSPSPVTWVQSPGPLGANSKIRSFHSFSFEEVVMIMCSRGVRSWVFIFTCLWEPVELYPGAKQS